MADCSGPAQSPPRCTKCNSPPINGQCTNFILFNVVFFPLHCKGLRTITKTTRRNTGELEQSQLYYSKLVSVSLYLFR